MDVKIDEWVLPGGFISFYKRMEVHQRRWKNQFSESCEENWRKCKASVTPLKSNMANFCKKSKSSWIKFIWSWKFFWGHRSISQVNIYVFALPFFSSFFPFVNFLPPSPQKFPAHFQHGFPLGRFIRLGEWQRADSRCSGWIVNSCASTTKA